jgi:Sodium:solute symporter family
MARRSAISRHACRPVLSQPCCAPCSRLPFLLAWLVALILLTAAIMAVIFGSTQRTGTVRYECGSRGHRGGARARARPELFGGARQADEPRAVDRGRPGIRRATGVSPHGGGNLHDLHLLGGSGFAYGEGGPAYYILGYASPAYVISHFMLPAIWRYAHENRLFSQPDSFVHEYRSPMLGIIVSLVGIVALIPYLVLQFKGLGIIVEAAGYGAIPTTLAIWIGATAATAYVIVSGVHGSAWTAVAKDVIILVVVMFLGINLPCFHCGGVGRCSRRSSKKDPGSWSCQCRARAPGGSARPYYRLLSVPTCSRMHLGDLRRKAPRSYARTRSCCRSINRS